MEGRLLDDDADLIGRARVGDLAAYERLVVRYQNAVLRVATLLGGIDDAPDIAQEAFVRAWRALGSFRDGAPFGPWLLRIVANQAHNTRRASGRRARLALRASEQGASVDGVSSTEEAVLAREQRRWVLDALERLSDRDRDVIACRYLAGLSETETATVLACRPGTVKSRLARALHRLRATLDTTAEPTVNQGATRD